MTMYTTESPVNPKQNQPSYSSLLVTVILMAVTSAFLGLGLGLVIEAESFQEIIGSSDFFVFLIFVLAVWGVNYIALESVTTSGPEQLTFFSALLMLVSVIAFSVQMEVVIKSVLYYYGSGVVLFTVFMYGIKAMMEERQ